jgi:hypothetical protein
LLFIVASPRAQVGKTFIARLLTDFLRLKRAAARGFDLNPSGDALRDYLPAWTTAASLVDIRGEMALFDGLIADDGTAKVVDVGHASFERFFAIAEEIDFFDEARHRALEPMILFISDPHATAAAAYTDLQQRFRNVILIPVVNEAILKGRKLRQQFPFMREVSVPLRITELAPLLKAQLELSSLSFADIHDSLPTAIPVALGLELQAWTRRTFLTFSELGLRRLLDQLRPSLSGQQRDAARGPIPKSANPRGTL